MSRRLSRESVFKALFQVDVGNIEPGRALSYSLQGVFLTEEEVSFTEKLFQGVIQKSEELNYIISNYLVKWKLDRIASVDRCLLRMALFEILHMPEIPTAVTINEALELSKKYGDADSTSFINGILDRAVHDQVQSPEREGQTFNQI